MSQNNTLTNGKLQAYCTLRNSTLRNETKRNEICTLRNENLYFPENRKPVKLRPSGCLDNLVPRKKTFFHSVCTPCRPEAGQG